MRANSTIIIIAFLKLLETVVNISTATTQTDTIPFIEFVKRIEDLHAKNVFYDKLWSDSMIVVRKNDKNSLDQVLNSSFKDTHFSYIIDGSNVIVTNSYIIKTTVSDDFFTPSVSTTNKREADVTFLKKTDNTQVASDRKTYVIGTPTNASTKRECTLSGTVRNAEDGQAIIGAQIFIKNLNKGTITDATGYYILTIPQGKNNVEFKYLGREKSNIPITVYNDGHLNVELKKSKILIDEVVIVAERENQVKNLNIGVQQLNMKSIQQLPTTMGEVDIVKSALLLPGVQTVGEGASGFNVRGGSAQQNLMLFDEIPIFNTSHLFGFFSVFNPETVEEFKLYKSGIPANYGGRISSVFDVKAKQGNLKNLSLSGGISPVTGKLTLEGPIIKDKLSFIVSGRTTYSDWILQRINNSQTRKSSANFHDFSAKLAYHINDKNELSFTAYQSSDNFSLRSDTSYHYKNKCARLFYKHYFTPKLYAKLSAIYSNYEYNIISDAQPSIAYKMQYDIDYKSLKTEGHYFPNPKHNIILGSEIIKYDITPGNFTPLTAASDITTFKLEKEHAFESGFYLSDEYTITERLSAALGLRYALFHTLGPYTEYHYNPLVPRRIESRMDSTVYAPNKVVSTYGGPEIRFSTRYTLGINNSVKFSYNRIHQFLHMISNSSAMSPTDVWKTSNPAIKPLIGDQVALGYYHKLFAGKLDASAEIYYKTTQNHIDYKPSAELLLNPDLDVSLLAGKGRAYGLEILLKKKTGKLNGWISYTLSKTELKIDSKFAEERINNGSYYPTDYDKTNNITLVTNYVHSRRYTLSSTLCYSTGRPITFPVAKYDFRGNQLMHYSNRNEYRIPDYFRWDIAVNIYENLKKDKLMHNYWSIGVYNLTGRHNAYSVYFNSNSKGKVKGHLLSVFAQPIVNISYNVRF